MDLAPTPMPMSTPAVNHSKHTCAECHTRSTPLWRKDSYERVLCNACGIKWKRYSNKRLKSKIHKDDEVDFLPPRREKTDKFMRLVQVAMEMYKTDVTAAN